MKKQIHELKMKLYEWRKKKIEDKYFKTFPERKGMATMEIVKSNVMPQTYYSSYYLEPWLDLETAKSLYIPIIEKDLSRKLGEDLLEKGMIYIVERSDPDSGKKIMIASIRVIPPMQETRWPHDSI